MDGQLRISILGPLSVCRGARVLPVGPPQQRALLAALLLRRGVSASSSELVDKIWGDAAPASAVAIVRQYVHGLRRAIGPDSGLTIGSSRHGYAAVAAAGVLDLDIFERLVAEADRARAASDPATAADRLREALTLWRGPALAGLPGPVATLHRPVLAQQHLSALITRAELDLELGRHREVQPELQALVLAHPLNEHLRQLLMTALYRCGRQADAIETFQDCRRLLAEKLGVDPGPGLRELYLRLVRADPGLAGSGPAPAWLPAFTGREESGSPLGEARTAAPANMSRAGTIAPHRAHQDGPARDADVPEGYDPHAWQRSWLMRDYLNRHGLWHHLQPSQVTDVAAAHRGDPTIEAHTLWGLALSEASLGRYRAAQAHLCRALAIFTAAGDAESITSTRRRIVYLLTEQGDFVAALEQARVELAQCPAGADPDRRANALNTVSWLCARLGRFDEAVAHARQAVALARHLRPYLVADIWNTLGFTQAGMGAIDDAEESYRRAAGIYHQQGATFLEAQIWGALGEARRNAGRTGEGELAFRHALALVSVTYDPRAVHLGADLNRLLPSEASR
ncbi:BTAD domain-containing putative transcriptional regulator [Dactylosporangium sp. CA-092794]|uniref:AfsR/SARP family transcriptional regulator n=1 Tax=Dactylosporangium sp. CA-092794 TaxID=3239929 RepID=UPI003D8F8BED